MKISNKGSASLHPALENLKEQLSSPRLKAASTISTYIYTGANFLSGLGKDREPTEIDFRRYFIRRRRQGISERTLRKEFVHLKKLAIANSWPFGAEGISDMTPPRKIRAKALATVNEFENQQLPALKNLVECLSSPRPRARGTILTYLNTAANFLSGLGEDRGPTDRDFRRHFIQRRQQGISERTLRKEFFHLKKLALANNWPWPFTSDDTPSLEKEHQLPLLEQAEIEQMIRTRLKLSRAERFYLAVATTWIVRRQELRLIKKRDYDENSIVFHNAKHGKVAKYLIPDCLKPVFADYRPKERSPSSLATMFKRICEKTGLEDRKGLGWDSIRYRLNTLLKEVCLPENRLSLSLIDDYTHWKKKTSSRHGGKAMTEDYRHPEVLDADPYGRDRVIYGIHPFLPFWGKKK